MSWAATLRQWWSELFPVNGYTNHLLNEIEYLRKELAQARIDRDRLQLMLNTVTPAGMMAERASHPQPRPTIVGPPRRKTWMEIEAERYAELDKKAKAAREALESKEQKAA